MALTEPGRTTAPRDVALLDLNTALEKLAEINQRLADLIALRYFGGLTVEETAEEMGLSAATVKRDWSRARAWMYRELSEEDAARPNPAPSRSR
jgi:RNA polymerase sigma factor (sigma-70 family)